MKNRLSDWFKLLTAAGVAAAVLAGCATDSSQIELSSDPTERVSQMAAMQDRLDRVGGALMTANTDVCDTQLRSVLGFSVVNEFSYSRENAPVARKTLGLTDELKVSVVVPGTGAERAGLKRGDIIESIAGEEAPSGFYADQDVAAAVGQLVAEGKPVPMTVKRNGQLVNLSVAPTEACAFRLEIGNTGYVNAFNDGKRILITQGMALYTKTDAELAFVVAHEMAHGILGHGNALSNDEVSKAIIDRLLFAGSDYRGLEDITPMSREYDLNADALSFALVLRAGYSLDGAVEFWRGFYERFPVTSQQGYSAYHPWPDSRLRVMPNAVENAQMAEFRRKNLGD